jgi:hypothetical protein
MYDPDVLILDKVLTFLSCIRIINCILQHQHGAHARTSIPRIASEPLQLHYGSDRIQVAYALVLQGSRDERLAY